MSLVEFQLDPEQGKLTTGYRIPRDTLMYSRPVGGVPCKFRSCYDTTLWPLTVAAAQWQTPDRLSPPVKDLEASAAFRLEFQLPSRKSPSTSSSSSPCGSISAATPTWSSPSTSCSATTASGSSSATLRRLEAQAGAAAGVPRSARWDSPRTKVCCPIPAGRSSPTGCCRSTSRSPRSSCSSISPGSSELRAAGLRRAGRVRLPDLSLRA